MSSRSGPRYGIDAPAVPVVLIIGAVVAIGFGVGATFYAVGLAVAVFVVAAVLLAQAVSYLYTTRVGKFAAWQRILADLGLRGDERVLDAGCGRGMVTTAVARLVPNGSVTGADIWRRADQSGNDESVAKANATAEGVADRVEFVTADLRELPWRKPRFDVVLSAAALHNIKHAGERETAVANLARVLKPGGRLVIADIRHTSEYARMLTEAGLEDVRIGNCGLAYNYGLFAPTRIVTARAPERAETDAADKPAKRKKKKNRAKK